MTDRGVDAAFQGGYRGVVAIVPGHHPQDTIATEDSKVIGRLLIKCSGFAMMHSKIGSTSWRKVATQITLHYAGDLPESSDLKCH